MTNKITEWDVVDYLDNPKAISEYLSAAFEIGNSALIVAALGDVVRSKGINKIARASGITRGRLCELLSKDSDPKLSTLLEVTKTIGFKLTVSPKKEKPKSGVIS